MIEVRKSESRGHARHGWLDSWHSFSFADYYDPARMGFGALRVINEDRIAPGAGFPTHGHQDMEIVTWMLAGTLEHKDSLGSGGLIRPGEVQRMSAGTGIRHSEFNASAQEAAHLLQIWLLPQEKSLTPGYEQKRIAAEEMQGRFRVIASPDGRDDSVTIHQDASIYAARLGAGESAELALAPQRRAYLQVARGAVELKGYPLQQGDAALLQHEEQVAIRAQQDAEVLLFDLA